MLSPPPLSPTPLPHHQQSQQPTALVLGGCSGSGYYAVLHLYIAGYKIYLSGRSKTRVLKCIDELKQDALLLQSHHDLQSHNNLQPPTVLLQPPTGLLHFLQVDFTDLASVVLAANFISSTESHLNLLINNLSTFIPYTTTADGFETLLQINYIAPFLLVTKLMPLLEAARGTFITTTSPVHRLQPKYFDLSNLYDYRPLIIFTWLRYVRSQVCCIHLVNIISLRNPDISCKVVDTGVVMNPSHFSFITRLPMIGLIFWVVFQVFGYLLGSLPQQGAERIIRQQNRGIRNKIAENMDYSARTWIWTISQLNERNIHI